MADKNLELETRKAVGALAAKLVKDIFRDISGIEDELDAWNRGDLSQRTFNAVRAYILSKDPSAEMQKALRDYLERDLAKKACGYIESRRFVDFVDLLCEQFKSAGDVRNPYAGSVEDVAKRLVGAPLTYIASPGNIVSGIITSTGAFNNEADHLLDTSGKEPGIVGKWYSPKRGGYSVMLLSAHEPQGAGCVAVWGATVENDKLSMNDVVGRFGIESLVGSSVLDKNSKLKVLPYAFPSVTDTTKIADGETKGKGCIAAYNLVSA